MITTQKGVSGSERRNHEITPYFDAKLPRWGQAFSVYHHM